MMRRRAALLGLTSATLLAMSLGFLPGLAAATSITIIDRFNSVSFSGSDGTQPWLAPWNEIGESDGPSTGHVSVDKTGSCSAGHCLELDKDTRDVGIARRADLSGATTATLTYTLTGKGRSSNGSLLVRVSPNGGSSWITVNQHGSGAAKSATHSVDIVPWAGPNTAVSFMTQQSSGYWFVIDDVIIRADIAAPTTTTTTTTAPSSTTTTTSPVTTTTLPPTSTTGPTVPSSTTTTIVPGASTTTMPGESTTTTVPIDSATTTIEPSDSSGAGTQSATSDGTPAQESEAGDSSRTVAQPQPATAVSARMKRTELAATGFTGAVGSTDDSEAAPRAPLTGLSGVFTGSMATIQSNLLQAAILGILLAWALVTGVGRRSKDDPPARDD